MASHLSDIGFELDSAEEFQQLALQAYEEGESISTATGRYVRWSPGRGIELWIQVDGQEQIIGINPHFSGSSLMRVGLTGTFRRSDDSSMDGSFHAWANPPEGDPESGDYPFVFDVPDHGLHDDIVLPSIVHVQLAAFAHELTAYESEEAYRASQIGEFRFASESFISSGLFSHDGEPTEPPQAFAIFSGHVLETSVVRNPVTQIDFCRTLVRTLGGAIDVVADPGLLDEPIVAGGIVSGSFWLSGRIVGK